MRIFMDEHGMGWEEAWDIVKNSVAYTNHTVMSEALERWPQDLIQQLLPRIWEIMCEINRRWCDFACRALRRGEGRPQPHHPRRSGAHGKPVPCDLP